MAPPYKTVLMLYDDSTCDIFCTACADGEPLSVYDATSHALGKPHNADAVVFHRRNRIPALSMVFSGVAVSGGSAAALASQGGAWEAVGGRETLIMLDTETEYHYCMECANARILGHDPPPDGSHYIQQYEEEEVVEHALGSPHHAKVLVIQKADGFPAIGHVLDAMWRANAPDDPPTSSPAPGPRTPPGGCLPDSLSDLARALADTGRRK